MDFKPIWKKVFFASLFLAGGCNTHIMDQNPKPAVEIPSSFSTQTSTAKASQNINPWWEDFERPVLNTLIEQSFQQNFDIKAAIARLKQANALTTQARADLYPEITLEGNLQDEWQGSDEQGLSGNIGGALSWEIDLFNRIEFETLADALEANARKQDIEAVKLSLSADIANAYFSSVAGRQRLDLLKQQIGIDRELLDLLSLRREEGIGTNVEVLQQESQVAESETLIPDTEFLLRAAENRLDVLLGTTPDSIRRVPENDTLNFANAIPDVGIPVNLILNRPDLQSLQAELIAADAEIGAAIANRLPNITLEGSYLYSNTPVYAGPLAALMSGFVQPLLDWGKRKAAVEENKALYGERLAVFTQSFLEAVELVENTLYQEEKQREFIIRLERRKNLLQKTADETESRYTEGIDDYLPVLEALQELRDIERDLIDEQLELVRIRIQLHRALGGNLEGNLSRNSVNPANQINR